MQSAISNIKHVSTCLHDHETTEFSNEQNKLKAKKSTRQSLEYEVSQTNRMNKQTHTHTHT